jgi:hypothetical protein
MNRFYPLIAFVIVTGTVLAQAPAGGTAPAKTVSTTIDFLDYCFYRTEPATGYFTEQQYEAVIRELAQAGFAKVYLRVDVCGRTLYPTTVGARYAGDGREPGSSYLVKTLEHYDPAAKTIELGHKYGLQVWCWYAFLDDEATMVHYSPDSDLGKRYGEYPLKDPFLVRNPHLQWRLDPRIEARQEAQAAGAGPVTAIRLRSDIRERANRIRVEDVQVYSSADGVAFRRQEVTPTLTVEQEKPAILVFSGLSVVDPYIQLAWRTPQPTDKSFTVAGLPGELVELFYDGAWHAAVADFSEDPGPPEQASHSFHANSRFAWDYGARRLGIAKIPTLARYYGAIELTSAEAREYKLAKLRELARYEFDGFAHSIRTHSQSRDPGAYGYGDAVREAFQKRYGKDIWREDFDREQWLALRAEGLNQYLRDAGRAVAPRPLFMDSPMPGSEYLIPYGGMPLQHETWLRDKSIAGIRMLGYPADQKLHYLLPAATAAKIVRFIDNWPVLTPEEFRTRLGQWLDEPRVNEVEFYETLLYSGRPEYLGALRQVLAERNLLPASAH